MSALAKLTDEYLAGVPALRKAIAGMSPEQMRARPVPGKWSTLEVLAHLADFEPILAERMKRILAEDRAPLLAADENHFAAALAYHDRDPEEELALVENTRRQMARILRAQPDAALQRVGVHSERGPLTLEQVLAGATRHIHHHLGFVAAKRKALGLPG